MKEEKALFDWPEGYEYTGETLMSNFDCRVDDKVKERLMNNKEIGDYAGWNFHATVWYDPAQKLWFGKVMQYRCHVDTITAATPEELMTEISNEYGHD